MPNAYIRPLEAIDQDYVFGLFSQLRTRKPVPFDAKEFVDNQNSHCMVVETEGKIVGFGALIIYSTPSKGRVAHIEDIIVDTSYRGRGYGRLIIEELIKAAEKGNVREIDLTSKRTRTDARKFYESLGFKIRESDIFRLNI
jgi:ribosomal protein S18 acetylase RimI-like enzyme